jgi:hypothetical protein
MNFLKLDTLPYLETKSAMYKKILILTLLILFTLSGQSYASNFGAGVHGGYGVIKYEEETSEFGRDVESDALLNTILFGVSVEYSFNRPRNVYAGITTDWTISLENDEEWREGGVKIAEGDLKMFGQFYDLRLGYKGSNEQFYYRVHISGGWDGLHFKRDKFVWRGTPVTGSSKEDISLWRAGIGTGVGYELNEWSLDGRIAYSYHFKGEVKNSELSGFSFDTNGTCLDGGLGLARSISDQVNFYIGGSYSLFRLDESDVEQRGSIRAVYPESKTQLFVGVFNLTYHF